MITSTPDLYRPQTKSGWHEHPDMPPARTDKLPHAHWSDCAVHNAPAYPPGPCDCGGYMWRSRERRRTAAAVLHAVVAFCSGAIVMGLILMPWVQP